MNGQDIVGGLLFTDQLHVGESGHEFTVQFADLFPAQIAQGDFQRPMLQAVQDLCRGFGEHGVLPVGVNFHERVENKTSVSQRRMRDHQSRFVNHLVAVAQQVEIEGAGPPVNLADTSQLGFD